MRSFVKCCVRLSRCMWNRSKNRHTSKFIFDPTDHRPTDRRSEIQRDDQATKSINWPANQRRCIRYRYKTFAILRPRVSWGPRQTTERQIEEAESRPVREESLDLPTKGIPTLLLSSTFSVTHVSIAALVSSFNCKEKEHSKALQGRSTKRQHNFNCNQRYSTNK